jgi:hypothetical protein
VSPRPQRNGHRQHEELDDLLRREAIIRAATMRLLEDRIAYHERKLAEERAASGQPGS